MSDTIPNELGGVAEEPKKRGPGRPKGSRNKTPGTEPESPVSGKKFVPNLDDYGSGVANEQKWWVGVFADCPVDFISIAGIGFCKATNRPYRAAGGKQQRQALIGGVVKMTKDKFDRLCEALPRTVIRVIRKRESEDGYTLDYGQKITIPTDEQIKYRKARGKTVRPYVRHPSDTPAAEWLFAVPHDGTEHGGVPGNGSVYPPSIADAGLEWSE